MINRLEFLILDTLNRSKMYDCYHSMTIGEIMIENDNALGARTTIYKKLKKLCEQNYIKKGVLDNHADTYYITKAGKDLLEGEETC